MSQAYKNYSDKLGLILILIGSVIAIIAIPLYSVYFSTLEIWHHGLAVLAFIIAGGFIIGGFYGIILHKLDLYDRYIVTSEELLIQEWKFLRRGGAKERSFWGSWRTKSLKLNEIKAIYHEKKDYWEGCGNNFYFYTELDTRLFFDTKNLPLQNEFREDPLEYTSLFHDKFGNSEFFFEYVDSPNDLLAVLQSLIPLDKHPILEDTYMRVE